MSHLKYSKEVMKNFMHPKNMGEIKNADGVGEVGNPMCLLPEEMIHTAKCLVPISHLKKGDLILTHNGNYEEINLVSSRNYKGKIIKLKNKLGELKLTPEHLVYAVKVPSENKFKRNKGKKQLIPSWYHAEHLAKGDIILYPKLKGEQDIKYLDINIPKLKYDFKSKDMPNRIPLNYKLLRLFGYFLAEGHIEEKPSKNFISFTINNDEKDIFEDIKNICKDLFGLDIKFKETPERKTLVIFLYNAKVARWFKALFGNGAKSKYLPEWIMNLPIEKQKHLIYGLWKGDGYFNLNRDGPRAGYATISYQLAQQIKTLLIRQNILPSIYLDKERISKWAKHQKAYRIHVGQRDSLIKLCKIFGVNYKPKSYESVRSWFDNNYLYTPITSVEKEKFSGKVYNLEVKEAHSFTQEAFCVHNCGDVMKVYIKVSKVGGKEMIKDIKFKTFGCASAIATSSMITQLAKGKNLLVAGKITNADVAESLKGLPPIKMHCSNLAADALKAAIKDYKSRKSKKGEK